MAYSNSFVPVAVKPTLGKAGMAIPAAFWNAYCDAPPPRPTWAEHKAKLDRLRTDDDLTRGVPRRRKKKHLAQARAAAVSEVDSLPTANRTIKFSPAVYGTPSCAHNYDEVIRPELHPRPRAGQERGLVRTGGRAQSTLGHPGGRVRAELPT